MYHPTTRLLTVLELLQTHEQISASQLAARLEVDARTVRRYIMMLQDMGIPIEAEMGRHGGYSLRPGFKLPPLMFTNEEALAVTLGLLVVRHLGLTAVSFPIEGVLAKLQRVLPEVLRSQIRAMQQTLIFDLQAPGQQVQGALLTVLGQAAHDLLQVNLTYQKDSDSTERTVDPYGLVYHDGNWYLVGYCHLRTAIRVFRVDRITQVTTLQTTFTVPAEFNSRDYLIHSFASMPDRWTVEVILGMTLEQAGQIIPPALGSLTQHPEGVLLHTGVDDLAWVAQLKFATHHNCAAPLKSWQRRYCSLPIPETTKVSCLDPLTMRLFDWYPSQASSFS